jgi:hypothetical protein
MNWLRYSGIWITFILNPLHWRIGTVNDTIWDYSTPNRKEMAFQLLFLTIRIVIDDGSW